MKKNVFGRQFKRDKNERTALFRGLISSLILKERIKTTEAKAKAIRSFVDKLVTKAKKGDVAKNFLQKFVYKDALNKLIKDVAPRFEKRGGGYTRIIRLGERLSDKAKVVLIEWTEGRKELVLSSVGLEKTAGNKKAKIAKIQRSPEIKKEVKTQMREKPNVSK